MTLPAINQIIFDVATVALLLMWYFPIRWIANTNVHPVKVNGLLHATLTLERCVIVVCMSFVSIIPTLFFFFAQVHILPKFIVAGHVGIWIATAPMFVITCYFQYYMLVFLKHFAVAEREKDSNTVIDDLRYRCAESFNLIEVNKNLKASQMNLAVEADKAIEDLQRRIEILNQENKKLTDKIAVLRSKEDKEFFNSHGVQHELRTDDRYYVRVNELVGSGILLRDGEPVSRAHAKRYLTKAQTFIKSGKSGGPLYAKVETLVRKGYEFTGNPLAKSLLYRYETERGEFYPIVPTNTDSKGLSHLRMYAGNEKLVI